MLRTLISGWLFIFSLAGVLQAEVNVPSYEKPFLYNPEFPSERMWNFRHKSPFSVYSTSLSVDDNPGILFHLPKGVDGGEVLAYDIGVPKNQVGKYKGLCFWIRGDGSDGVLRIGTSWSQKYGSALVGDFTLSKTKWRKVHVPFSKFSESVAHREFWFLNFRIIPKNTLKSSWVALSRVHLYKRKVVEKITPRELADPAGHLPAENFISASDKLASIKKRLAEKKPVKLLIMGDSITAGAQLWYMAKEGVEKGYLNETYGALLFDQLKQYYKYTTTNILFNIWDPQRKLFRTYNIHGKRVPLKWKNRGLEVIIAAGPAQRSPFGVKHFKRLARFKPHLTLWNYGANDAINSDYTGYQTAFAELQKLINNNGRLLVPGAITPYLGDLRYMQQAKKMAEVVRQEARKYTLPLIDFRKAFAARGESLMGDLFSDSVHPNGFGHIIMARLTSALLGVPYLKVWDRPFIAKQLAN